VQSDDASMRGSTKVAVATGRHQNGGLTAMGAASAGVVAAIALTVLFVAATTARAATVRTSFGGESGWDQVIFSAVAGERNQVLISPIADPDSLFEFVIRDGGAVITPGTGCAAVDQHTVRCRGQLLPYPGSLGEVVARLGDGDDELRVSELPSSDLPPTVIANGGAGNDELVGGSGWDPFGRLDGGPGDDQVRGADGGDDLRGGGGRDQLYGLGGDDRLSDGDRDRRAGKGGPGRDLLDGGAGDDTVSYDQRTASVAVNIGDDQPDGGRGEGDRLTSIESITGGRGNDRLLGDRQPNTIDGGGGRDRINGRGGDDMLAANAGTVECGHGRDSVRRSSFSSFIDVFLAYLTRDCEAIEGDHFENPLPAYPALARPRFVRYRVGAVLGVEGEAVPTSGSVRLEEAFGRQRLLARARFRAGGTLVTVPLTALGRRLASRRRGVKSAVLLTHKIAPDAEPENPGGTVYLEWIIQLKVPR
jgi:Ca2+-binding RTX toxin-like protein